MRISPSLPRLSLLTLGLLIVVAIPQANSSQQFRFQRLAAFRKQYRNGARQTSVRAPLTTLRGGAAPAPERSPLMGVLRNYWYLGLIGFGGTPAHVALLHEQQTASEESSPSTSRPPSLTAAELLELTSLLHAIPGPTSTQLIIVTAAARSGFIGAIVALLFWTLPGFAALCLAGLGQGSSLTTLARWLRDIPPVALVISIKSLIKFVSSLDGMQKLVATVVCVLATSMTGKRYAAAPQFLFPLLLAGGGFLTLLEDWGGEQSIVFSSSEARAPDLIIPNVALINAKIASEAISPKLAGEVVKPKLAPQTSASRPAAETANPKLAPNTANANRVPTKPKPTAEIAKVKVAPETAKPRRKAEKPISKPASTNTKPPPLEEIKSKLPEETTAPKSTAEIIKPEPAALTPKPVVLAEHSTLVEPFFEKEDAQVEPEDSLLPDVDIDPVLMVSTDANPGSAAEIATPDLTAETASLKLEAETTKPELAPETTDPKPTLETTDVESVLDSIDLAQVSEAITPELPAKAINPEPTAAATDPKPSAKSSNLKPALETANHAPVSETTQPEPTETVKNFDPVSEASGHEYAPSEEEELSDEQEAHHLLDSVSSEVESDRMLVASNKTRLPLRDGVRKGDDYDERSLYTSGGSVATTAVKALEEIDPRLLERSPVDTFQGNHDSRLEDVSDEEEVDQLLDSILTEADSDFMRMSSDETDPLLYDGLQKGDMYDDSSLYNSGSNVTEESWWNQNFPDLDSDPDENNTTRKDFFGDSDDIFDDDDDIFEDKNDIFDDYYITEDGVFFSGEESSTQQQPSNVGESGATRDEAGTQSTALLQQTRGGSLVVNSGMLQRGGGVAGNNSSSVPAGLAAIILWVSVLLATTFIHSDNTLYQIFSENYQLGSALLGGGPMVVPLLAARVIQTSLSENQFFQGASMAQSLPGPLFNFAAYVGAMQQGGLGAVAAHIGILAPGCILAFALLPLWLELSNHRWFRSSLRGVSAAGVGLLASTCIVTFGTCIQQGSDFMVFLTSGVVLFFTDLPAPIMLIVGAGLGAILSKLAIHERMF